MFFCFRHFLRHWIKNTKIIIMPEVLTLSSMADAEPDLSTFENKTGLAEDMKFLASMPELCDVTFLVGDTREPVCAVKVCFLWIKLIILKIYSINLKNLFLKAVLASRSRVFQKMLYQAPSPQRKKEPPPRENKLRLFLKRSSEPLLNLQNAAQQVHSNCIILIFNQLYFLLKYIQSTWKCLSLFLYTPNPSNILFLFNLKQYLNQNLYFQCQFYIVCFIFGGIYIVFSINLTI